MRAEFESSRDAAVIERGELVPVSDLSRANRSAGVVRERPNLIVTSRSGWCRARDIPAWERLGDSDILASWPLRPLASFERHSLSFAQLVEPG